MQSKDVNWRYSTWYPCNAANTERLDTPERRCLDILSDFARQIERASGQIPKKLTKLIWLDVIQVRVCSVQHQKPQHPACRADDNVVVT